MIQLAADCLVFKTDSGDLIPCSAEMVSIELVGTSATLVDPELVRNAAVSVLHYFRVELCRDTVTLGEFSEALERVLLGFGVMVQSQLKDKAVARPETRLDALAQEAGAGGELQFFPRLRETVRVQLEASPGMLRFGGLRDCVKMLTHARRWSPRCRTLHDQIVRYLRDCLSMDHQGASCKLMVH